MVYMLLITIAGTRTPAKTPARKHYSSSTGQRHLPVFVQKMSTKKGGLRYTGKLEVRQSRYKKNLSLERLSCFVLRSITCRCPVLFQVYRYKSANPECSTMHTFCFRGLRQPSLFGNISVNPHCVAISPLLVSSLNETDPPKVRSRSVSYTHLTLPTIPLV